MGTRGCFLAYGALVMFLIPGIAAAQQGPGQQGIGIVTAIQGQATVSRTSLPQPAALRFKDDVFFRDQIATQERATVRLLLGGKGTLTIREQSQVTLDESVSQDGSRQSVVGLLGGKIGAAIARALMGPGEAVEIRTPNAVAAVRGTVLIAEYIPPEGSAKAPQPVLLASAAPGPLMAQAPGAGGTSNFIVLSGQVNITIPGMPPLTLGPLQGVQITSTPAGIQPGAVQTLTPGQAAQAAQGLQAGKSHTGETGNTAGTQAQMAAAVATAIVQAATGQPGPTAPPTSITTNPTPTTLVAPVVPQVPPSSLTPNNLPNGPLLKLNNAILTLADGVALATFSAGSPNAITPLEFSGSGEEAPVIEVPGPLLTVTGNPITHSGSIVKLDGGAAIVGSSSDMTTPLVKIDGTTLTNSGGPVFDLNGESALATLGPVLQLDNGANATLAGVMSLQGNTAGFLGPADALVVKNGSSVTATDALFSLTGSSVLATFGGSLVFLDPSTLVLQAPILSLTGDSEAILSGPVLHAVDSTVTSSQPLVSLQGNSMLTSASGPFVQVSGGSLTADSIVKAQGEAATIALHGSLLDLTDSTATFRVLTDISNADFTHTLEAGERFVTVDTALLDAAAPIINLINSTLTTSATGDGTTGAMHLYQSQVTSLGPVFGLDKSTLTVQNGPLLALTGGSHMTVNNDFATLTNGSKIWVQNGPLIYVDGAGSQLTVNGALTNFVGTDNKLIVNNSISPNQGVGTNVASFVDKGSSVTIGPTPYKNLTGNTVSLTGSLIKATGGGTVTITAPSVTAAR